uniref:Uncharacterized protein DDB_G0271670-like n=1 Tax=Diabrotica virgifera virgifera TaxID=50390 RepID=A0A6P7GH04_DIAVI
MMKGRGLVLLQKAMEATSNNPDSTNTGMKLRENSTTLLMSTKVTEEILVNNTMELQKNPTKLASPSTSAQVKPSYCISPVNSHSSNLDDSDADPHFNPSPKTRTRRLPLIYSRKRSRSSSSSSSSSNSSSSSSNSSSSSSSSNTEISSKSVSSVILDSANLLNEIPAPETSTSQSIIDQSADPENHQRGRKRTRNPAGWSSNIKKLHRNTGKAYVSSTNKSVPERAIKPPCNDKCRLKCKTKIGEILRKTLFENFWQMGETLIRTAKKTGKPYYVEELTHDKFYDIKTLQEEWGNNFTVNDNREQVKWHDIKQLRVEKQQPMTFFYKTSYEETVFKKVFVRNQRRTEVHKFSPLKQAYLQKIPLGDNKKRDIMELIDKKIIPQNYVDSYYKNALGIE